MSSGFSLSLRWNLAQEALHPAFDLTPSGGIHPPYSWDTYDFLFGF